MSLSYRRLPARLFYRFILWPVETLLLGLVLGFIALLNIRGASFLFARLFALIGPFTPWHRRAKQQLQWAMPELGTDQISKILDGMWQNLGRNIGEYPKLGAMLQQGHIQFKGTEHLQKYWLPWLVGMPAESSRAISSLIFGGVFERLPKLKVAIAHGGGSFPATIGRIEHGFNVRPDLCAIDNDVNPKDYIGKFWLDSLVHDKQMLDYIVGLWGADKVALGTDYPFPLGELQPGELIHSMSDDDNIKSELLAGAALQWLGLKKDQFE